MPEVERRALLRGAEYWLPKILYGSDAVRDEKPDTTSDISALPGGQIVKAY